MPVPFVEYVNVRIRARFRRLIDRETYDSLIVGDDLGVLTTFLLDRPGYGTLVEQALHDLPEHEGLERGVADYFTTSVSDVLGIADDTLRKRYELAIHQFDLRNLRTLLIARRHQYEFSRLHDMIIPCGILDRRRLRMLYAAPDIPAMSAMLGKWYPLGAMVLRQANQHDNGNRSFVVFLNRIEQYIVRQLFESLDSSDESESMIVDLLKLEIDMKNILAAIKYVWAGIDARDNHPDIFMRGGNIPAGFLFEMIQRGDLDEVFEMVESTPFHEAVEKGIIYYAETGFLADMEHFFEEVYVQRTQRSRRYHPFGIGVFVGYLWAQYAEMTNLRTIINGIAFHSGPGQIKKGLMYV